MPWKILFLINFIWVFGLAPALAAEEGELESGMINPGYAEKPAWFKNSFLDLREDIAEAAQENRRLLLYFYQDGCPYCAKLLRDNFTQKRIADKTRQYFDVIAINMWGDREVTDFFGASTTEKNFAAALRVMFTPTILMLDEKGRVVLRINGYYAPAKFEAALDYVGLRLESRLSFRDYYRQQPRARALGKLHDEPFFIKPPYDLQHLVATRKPLMLLFEQKVCQPCDEQHTDIFKRKDTLVQLRRFNVVRLDMWASTPLVDTAGRKITAAELAKQLNINYAPTMVFFDGSKDEVFRTEAYLKAFHIQSSMDYVASGAYKTQSSFQRFISARAERLEAAGVHIDLWK